jgi:multiple sugar transport system substrate-binding protein
MLGKTRTLLLSAAVLSGALMGSSGGHAETALNALFMSQAAYSEDDVRAMTADFMKEHPDIKVNLEFVPYEGLRDKTLLAQGAGSGFDVVLFDVIWPAEFAQNKVLRDVTDRVTPEMNKGVLPGAWTTVEYSGKRYGMPWILDTKYLFYNTEMLSKAGFSAPPKTWTELQEQAKAIKQKGIVEYPIVWSWAQAEAAICDYTTLVAANQGQFFDSSGKPAFQKGGGLEALTYMLNTEVEGLSNPHSREYLEEDVRRVFSSGQAAFALNWTYMYNLANDPKESQVAGKVGVAPAPGVEGKTEASAVNGSMGLGITTTSKHPDEAWTYITYMTSKPVQEKYARLSLPIWAASYTEPSVTKGQEPLVAAAQKSLGLMFPRPTTPKYQELSTALQQAIQSTLQKSESPEQALQSAAQSAGGL